MRVGIFVTDALSVAAKDELDSYDVFGKETSDANISRCQVLIAWPHRVRKDLLDKMKALKFVQSMSAGVDGMDFRAIPPSVMVCSNAGAYTESVAEHAWGLILGLAKGIHARNTKTVPVRLGGGTLLVVGCGAIGSEVARHARALGMKTLGVSRSFRVPENFGEMSGLADLRDAIGRADAVAIALPLTRETRGLINSEVLARAKERAIIVNVGRGETVVESDLLDWLRKNPESRFATDVFWTKDGRESFATPAWELPNFSGTLHVSGLPFGGNLDSAKLEAARNVRRYLEGGLPTNVVNISEYS